jgi:hypothetical protein
VEIPLRIEIPRNRIRKSAKDTREQVWDTILKREAVAIGHIHECDACAAPCDDPENQMVVPNGNEGSRIVEAHSRLDVLTECSRLDVLTENANNGDGPTLKGNNVSQSF